MTRLSDEAIQAALVALWQVARDRGEETTSALTTVASELTRLRSLEVSPVPMRLVCEGCGELHLDTGRFATKPHHTHACQNPRCGLVWRPAVVNTVGVRFLPGFQNVPPDFETPKG